MSKVAVFGAGRSGRAAAELMRREGREVVVLDDRDGASPGWAEGCELAVASPGVPPGHPWFALARERSIPVVSELQLGVERFLASGGRALAVTGSKGKSSVVKAVADALSLAGFDAVPCGNYGLPVCELPMRQSGAKMRWAVVEVSSFQLETTSLPGDAFEAAAILNLQDDHLDRHGSRERYHALKRRLLGFTSRPFDFSGCKGPFDTHLFAGSYFDNPVLAPNGAAAVQLMRASGLDDRSIAAAFAAFKPLPHRFSLVAQTNRIRWIDDSKATSIAALGAGVEMASSSGRPVLLIAGGLPKGDSPHSVISLLEKRVKKVYLIGVCAPEFLSAWGKWVACEMCGTLPAAVEAARRDAEPGETVLLSPGAASFDQFSSYGERGDIFAALAKEGMKNEQS